eukprot:CAMPEP_0117694310 /NCGR_PEP_ID=MMETSP0804-20121206/27378_1 /TAXON_ID=1074897 /ORGANISM="Tetraselmis astigmatica, Strain CCMP880" /LENGTH=539 /DNA_ID=CAMNT_0005507987 /DNA_START=403 /DNA_END=2022 /DNA_ORIENTATION=-
MAFKLRGATPADLQPDLKDRLAAALQVEPDALTGVIRPGCVQLGLTVRCGTWGRMRESWGSVLSHVTWDETLLVSHQGDNLAGISMSLEGASYAVRNGKADYSLSAPEAVSIETVEPSALPLTGTVATLAISGLDSAAHAGLKVLLQTSQAYHDLELISVKEPAPRDQLGDGMTIVAVWLPGGVIPGLGSLQVMLDTDDNSLVLSNSFPVMFTPLKAVAEEMTRLLPASSLIDAQRLAALIEDVSGCLHGGTETTPRVLLKVISLGLTECFSRLAVTRTLLQAADRMGQRLLGTAAQSNSELMVHAVIWALRRHQLPVDPCKQADDAEGYTALHWAAYAGNYGVAYLLLAETSYPQERWGRLLSRNHGKTPAEIAEEQGCPFFLDEAVLTELRAARGGAVEWQWNLEDDVHSSGSCSTSNAGLHATGLEDGEKHPRAENASVFPGTCFKGGSSGAGLMSQHDLQKNPLRASFRWRFLLPHLGLYILFAALVQAVGAVHSNAPFGAAVVFVGLHSSLVRAFLTNYSFSGAEGTEGAHPGN